MPKFVAEFIPDPDWPETGRLPNGKIVKLAEVDGLVKAGKIKVADAHEIRIDVAPHLLAARPWHDAGYWVDDAGEEETPVVSAPDGIMTRSELEGLGYTDDELEALRAKFFGKPDPNAPKLSSDARPTLDLEVYRRKVFDAVWTRLFEG